MTSKAKNYILLVIATIIGVLTSYFIYDATENFVAYLFVGISLPLIVFLIASFFTKDENEKADEAEEALPDVDTKDAE